MDQLISFDHWLFEKINLDWTNGFFDWLFPSITDLHKTPEFLVAILPLIAFWIYRRRTTALKWLLVLIFSVGSSDLVSYRVLKAMTERKRPVEAGLSVKLRTHHHSGTSFPSNHAANVFAAATVLTASAPPTAPLWFGIAGAVAYSRVYVGVHFPLDVTVGALLGIVLGLFWSRVFRRWIRGGAGSSRERS